MVSEGSPCGVRGALGGLFGKWEGMLHTVDGLWGIWDGILGALDRVGSTFAVLGLLNRSQTEAAQSAAERLVLFNTGKRGLGFLT